MGATASRSPAPVVTTTRIHGYSMLLRPQTFDHIVFCGLRWNVIVCPHRDPLNDLGLAHNFLISVEIDYLSRGRLLDSGLHKHISIGIEILDESGKHTVFQDRKFLSGSSLNGDYLSMFVSRRELEASSCVRNGGFVVRCTMTMKQLAAKGILSKSKKLATLGAMAGSHTLIIDSFSKLKAALRHRESAYSTCFAVGGCTWYLKLCPNNGDGFVFLFLVCANKVDETPTMTEFNFELEGVMNFESHKMTHTFHHATSQYFFRYKLEPLSSSSAMYEDRLLVRCHLAVLAPAVTIPIQVASPSTKSVLTPLLRAMYE